MFMSFVLAVGYLQPVGVFASEDVISDDTGNDDDNAVVDDGSSSDNKSDKKKKKENPQDDKKDVAPVKDEPVDGQSYQVIPETVIPQVVLPPDTGIGIDEFNEIYSEVENVVVSDNEVDRSAMNSILLYDENVKEVWMVKGQKIELPSNDWVLADTRQKSSFSIKKNIGRAKKVCGQVDIRSKNEPGKTLSIHITQPQMKPGTITLGEGMSAEIEFAYDEEHFNAAYISSNPNVISVSGNTVKALNKGSATVDVYVGGQKYSKKIKVDSISKIKDFSSPISLTVGQSVKVHFKEGFVTKGATWSVVSGNSCIKLTDAGQLTGLNPGKAEIKGVDKKGTERTLEVTVFVPEKELYLETGANKTVKFYKVKNNEAIWRSDDTRVAQVDDKGRITAGTDSGSTVVTCINNGVEYRTNVYVENPEFTTDEELSAVDGKYTIRLGEGTWYGLVTAGVYRDVEYKSSAPAVAFVDEFGHLQARKAGNSATITAIAGSRRLSIKVVVRKRRIVEVPAKYVNVLDYGAIPYDDKPDHDAINAAIEAAAVAPELDYTVYIPEGYYNIDVTRPEVIKLKSNVKLIMDPKAVLHVNATPSSEYSIISIKQSENVLVQGGQIEGGRSKHEGSSGQWGHGVVVGTYSKNVEIRDMLIYDNWGDGLYVYSSDRNVPPSDIKVYNCELYHNRRNNISVIGVDGLLIEDCSIENAEGSAPMAGMDVEPNIWSGEGFRLDCKNIKLKNCILSTPDGRSCTEGEYNGNKYWVYYSFIILRGTKTVIADTIELEGCVFNGDVDTGDSRNVSFKNCNINGTLYYDKNRPPELKNCKVKSKCEF